MDRLVVLLVAVLAFTGAAGWAGAQDATPGAGATPCPSAASPVASPAALPAASPMGSPVASPVASPVGAGCRVEIADFAFEPAVIEVAVGTTVTWSNRDSSPHTVTGDDGGFDSGRLDPEQNFEHTFDRAGSYAYHCDFHPMMQGTVVVR